MESEANTSQQNGNQQKAANPKRSASYPVLTISEAYNFALKIYNKFSNAEVTRKEIGGALGVNDLSISREVAAVASYGFYDKILHKGEKEFKYRVTSIFKDIYRYENEKQKKLSFIIAFGKPKLFQELITKFDGSVIPEELPNTLIKHHGITETASKEAAETFIISGKEVGVINENRFLNYKVTQSVTEKSTVTDAEEIQIESEENTPRHQITKIVEPAYEKVENHKKVEWHLTGDKTAYLIYPSDLNDDDIEILDYNLKGIKLRLTLEKKNKGDIPPS